MPAILKGWLDRALVYGDVYTSKKRYDHGRFRGRRAMLSLATGAFEESYTFNGRNADIDLLLWPISIKDPRFGSMDRKIGMSQASWKSASLDSHLSSGLIRDKRAFRRPFA